MSKIKKISGKTQYEITGLCKHTVKLGGSGSKFVPNLNHSFFNDQYYLNINRKSIVVDTETETLSNGKVYLKVGKETQEIYINGDRLEWDTIIDEPTGRVIEYDLEFSENVSFDYQDTLENEFANDPHGFATLADYQAAITRPDDVVGSYAIVVNQRNGKYETGKVAHVYRPTITDSDGTTCFGELKIEKTSKKKGVLSISIPESFYTSATFPIRIDPNLGYATQGASVYTTSAIWACMNADCRAVSNGTGVHLHAYITRVNTDNIHLAWYTRGSDNLPETRNDDNTISVSSTGWQVASISNSIVSGTYYHPAVCKPATNLGLHYDSSSGNRSWYNGTNAMPASDPTASNDTWNYSVYLEYTEASSVSIPVIAYHLRQQGVQ